MRDIRPDQNIPNHNSGIWKALLLCFIPAVIYWILFFKFTLNVNYIAYDDTLILGILPAFEDASWYERWKLLSGLFPEHRLVFSRSVVLLTYQIFGKADLTYLMIVANLCYTGCIWVFYKAFKHFQLSLWYFVPVAWIWFCIQAFENMFWGVSSLCNFGVLLFVFLALYYASFEENKPWKAILFALIATFTYGNGLFSFAIILFLFWIKGNKIHSLLTLAVTATVVVIYFSDFKPITQNLNFRDWEQVRQGFFGLFGFIGSVSTLSAYESRVFFKYFASICGMVMVIILLIVYRQYLPVLWKGIMGKKAEIPAPLRFVLALALFILITALATTYKRIPTDTFEGMFKGRYRMYSVLSLVVIYMGIILTIRYPIKSFFLKLTLPLALIFNGVIAYFNIADIINNRRLAVAQEFNTRYNTDWLGLAMFDMDQSHFEKIRNYYQSADPLAEGWDPSQPTALLGCEGKRATSAVFTSPDGILHIKFENKINSPVDNYSEGSYVLLKSDQHVYISAPHQTKRSFTHFLTDFTYLNSGINAAFHTATIQPGEYRIYLLEHRNGQNRIFCTDETWVEHD